MTQIILTEEQMQALLRAPIPVQVCDPKGNVLGTIDRERSPEFFAEMKRQAKAPGPRYTMEQVRNHLKALEEAWEREGEFDETRMWEILEEVRAREKQ